MTQPDSATRKRHHVLFQQLKKYAAHLIEDLATAFQSCISKSYERFRGPELPKVAVSSSSFSALSKMIMHLPPIAGCVVFLVLAGAGYQVHDESTRWQALAFVSKIHEVWMQATIADLVATIIRYEALSDHGIPFGWFLASTQAEKVSYVWSLEFWAALMSPGHLKIRRMWFALFLLAAIALASAVGPSSNILIVPRPMTSFIGHIDVEFYSTEEEAFPSRLDAQILAPLGCDSVASYNDSEPFFQNARCEETDLQSVADITKRRLSNTMITGARSELGGIMARRQLYLEVPSELNSRSIATTQYASFAGIIDWFASSFVSGPSVLYPEETMQSPDHWNFFKSKGLRHVIHTKHRVHTRNPYVATTCSARDRVLPTCLDFPPVLRNGEPITASDTHLQINNNSFLVTDKDSIEWINVPTELSNQATLLAIILSGNLSIFCTIGATWGPAEINTTAGGPFLTSRVDGPTIHPPWTTPDTWPTPLITITRGWASQLNPSDPHHMNQTLQQFIPTSEFTSDRVASRSMHAYVFSNMLSGLVAAGMSRHSIRTDFTASFQYGIAMQPSPNWPALNMSSTNYRTRVESFYVGPGYSTESIPVKIAMVVLTIYIVLILTYHIHLVVTGRSSTCWATVRSITALALASPQPASLRNTSAGISTARALGTPVAIRACDRTHLELVFLSEEDNSRRLSTVLVDKKY